MKKDVFPAAASLAATIALVTAGLVLVIYMTGRSLSRPTNASDIDSDDDDDDMVNDHTRQLSSTNNCRLWNHSNIGLYESARPNNENQFNFTNDVAPLILSKKGMKKQLKYERKVQNRKMKKQKERQKRHEEALSKGRDIQKEQELVAQRTMIGDGWRRRQALWETEKLPWVLQSFHVCIDCSYEPFMTKKEITSLAAQIRCCYAYNKRNDQPCQLVVTNLSMQQSPETLRLLQQEKGYNEWNNRAFISTELSPHEFYNRSDNGSPTISTSTMVAGVEHHRQPHRITNIIYLTSDSENTLLTLDNDTVYVIGGIVDRNRHKGIAYARALSFCSNEKHGRNDNHHRITISTAKLPLMEYIAHMPSTPVLTINHVFHILLQYRNHNNDWNAAFQSVLPARKEAQYIYQ